MKYRVIWNQVQKVVTAVIEDQAGTITNYPDNNLEHAVVGNLSKIKAILQSEQYDVAVIDQFQSENID